MKNVINAEFGARRDEKSRIDHMVRLLTAEPFCLQEHNAELLGRQMSIAYDRFREAMKGDISWNPSDPPEKISRQLDAYAHRIQYIAMDEMYAAFFLALGYGCHETPRARP